jgi:DnaK suppressor protein
MSATPSALTHATSAEHHHLRALLLQHRSARLDQIQGHDLADPTVSDLDPGVQRRTLETARRVVEEIDRAMARLAAGTYGLCTRCSQAIAPERLATLPYVSLCIGCADRQ